MREQIDTYLRPLNRRLATNTEGSVYFLAWRQLNDEAREQLSRQLSDTLNSLMPMLEWLQLMQEALGTMPDRPRRCAQARRAERSL